MTGQKLVRERIDPVKIRLSGCKERKDLCVVTCENRKVNPLIGFSKVS